uniref:(northern house mosquito) hypothetical protein n=1 Tax=Culex pipiens TaxID=7175 RepID=A0A8D8MQ29_CULPI
MLLLLAGSTHPGDPESNGTPTRTARNHGNRPLQPFCPSGVRPNLLPKTVRRIDRQTGKTRRSLPHLLHPKRHLRGPTLRNVLSPTNLRTRRQRAATDPSGP